MSSTHALARRFAEAGYKVFPATADKNPPEGYMWKTEATTDLVLIDDLGSDWDEYVVAVVLPAGVVVVDADTDAGQLAAHRHGLTVSPMSYVSSSRHGAHYWYVAHNQKQGPLFANGDRVGDLKVGGYGYVIVPTQTIHCDVIPPDRLPPLPSLGFRPLIPAGAPTTATPTAGALKGIPADLPGKVPAIMAAPVADALRAQPHLSFQRGTRHPDLTSLAGYLARAQANRPDDVTAAVEAIGAYISLPPREVAGICGYVQGWAQEAASPPQRGPHEAASPPQRGPQGGPPPHQECAQYLADQGVWAKTPDRGTLRRTGTHWEPVHGDELMKAAGELAGGRFSLVWLQSVAKLTATYSPTIEPGPGPNGPAFVGDGWMGGTIHIPWRRTGGDQTVWTTWLADRLPDPTLHQAAIDVLAYAMLGDQRHHYITFAVGPEATGKSTYLKGITKALGSGNVAMVSPDQLIDTRFASVDLANKLANIVGDVAAHHLGKNPAILKQLSGDGVLRMERKFGDAMTVHSTAAPIYGSNTDPAGDGTSGWARRLVVLPFVQRIPDFDPAALGALYTDDAIQGLVSMAVARVPHVAAHGIDTGAAGATAKANVLDTLPVTELYERVAALAARTGRITSADLRQECQEFGHHVTPRLLMSYMKDRGWEMYRTKAARYWTAPGASDGPDDNDD